MKPPVNIIAGEVRKQGVISFARFMELALYCPVCGFYEKEADTIGRRGDFYTSVSVGSLFGELLAFQFSEWLAQLQTQAKEAGDSAPGLKIIEAGAHDGRLADDVLNWMHRCRPGLFDRIGYVILEPSANRRQWQQRRLAKYAPRVRWVDGLDSLGKEDGCELHNSWQIFTDASQRIDGIIFSNEYLDAFPVHRLGWDAVCRDWFEWGVALAGDRFIWAKMKQSANADVQTRIPRLSDELLGVLPDGYTIEVSTTAESWWRQAAAILRRGRMLTIDYGLAEEEFFAPERSRGTLRAYHRHHVSHDVLACAGEQDLTAHVNFTAIQRAGEMAGLKTEVLEPQASFLTRIAERAWRAPMDFGVWTPAHTRQLQTLTHPEHLGRSFQVLVQAS